MPQARRAAAVAAAYGACPRCSAGRATSQTYCLECGLRLPVVEGPLAALRRRWLLGIGWYPGDWVWLPLAALVLAAGGAAAAIQLERHHATAPVTTFVAPTPAPLPTSPAVSGPDGRTVWPSGLDGWTIVLVSLPAERDAVHAYATAESAAHAGLPQVGVVVSSDYSSLHPGYDIIFSGVYGTAADAETALDTVRTEGFGGAYVVRVAA